MLTVEKDAQGLIVRRGLTGVVRITQALMWSAASRNHAVLALARSTKCTIAQASWRSRYAETSDEHRRCTAARYMGTAGPLRVENRLIDILAFAFVLFFIVPLVISAVLYALGDRVKEWRTADRSSAGFSRPPAPIRARPCASFRHAPFAGAASSQLIAGSS